MGRIFVSVVLRDFCSPVVVLLGNFLFVFVGDSSAEGSSHTTSHIHLHRQSIHHPPIHPHICMHAKAACMHTSHACVRACNSLTPVGAGRRPEGGHVLHAVLCLLVAPSAIPYLSLWSLQWHSLSLPAPLSAAVAAACTQGYLYIFCDQQEQEQQERTAVTPRKEASLCCSDGSTELPPAAAAAAAGGSCRVLRLSLSSLEESAALCCSTERSAPAAAAAAAAAAATTTRAAAAPAAAGEMERGERSLAEGLAQQQQQMLLQLLQQQQHQMASRHQSHPIAAAAATAALFSLKGAFASMGTPSEQQLQQQVLLLQREIEGIKAERDFLRQQLQQRDEFLSALSVEVAPSLYFSRSSSFLSACL